MYEVHLLSIDLSAFIAKCYKLARRSSLQLYMNSFSEWIDRSSYQSLFVEETKWNEAGSRGYLLFVGSSLMHTLTAGYEAGIPFRKLSKRCQPQWLYSFSFELIISNFTIGIKPTNVSGLITIFFFTFLMGFSENICFSSQVQYCSFDAYITAECLSQCHL